MENIVSKISSYELLNNLVPGGVALLALDWFNVWSFAGMDMAVLLLLAYVVGILCSRAGSLLLEPLAKRMRIVGWREYRLYLQAESEDNKLANLQAVSNMYRSLAGCLVFVLVIIILDRLVADKTMLSIILLCFSFVLFIICWRKQTECIVARIDECTNK